MNKKVLFLLCEFTMLGSILSLPRNLHIILPLAQRYFFLDILSFVVLVLAFVVYPIVLAFKSTLALAIHAGVIFLGLAILQSTVGLTDEIYRYLFALLSLLAVRLIMSRILCCRGYIACKQILFYDYNIEGRESVEKDFKYLGFSCRMNFAELMEKRIFLDTLSIQYCFYDGKKIIILTYQSDKIDGLFKGILNKKTAMKEEEMLLPGSFSQQEFCPVCTWILGDRKIVVADFESVKKLFIEILQQYTPAPTQTSLQGRCTH